MIKGWVYIITNKAMPGLLKVGFSMKDPTLRARELGHTGSPHSYDVEYEVLVDEPHDIEQRVHSHLREHREGKEWFRCSFDIAVSAIRGVTDSNIYVENFKRADKGDVEVSIKTRETEIAHQNKAVEAQRLADAQKLFDQANIFFQTKQWSQSIEAFQKVTQMRPDWALGWCGLGRAYKSNGQIAGAIESFQQAIKINSQDANTWTDLGYAYIEEVNENLGLRGKLMGASSSRSSVESGDKAISAIKKAISIKPDFARAWHALASVNVKFQKYNEAIEAHKKVMSIEPESANNWLLLGRFYLLLGNLQKASEVYQHLIKLDPELAKLLKKYL